MYLDKSDHDPMYHPLVGSGNLVGSFSDPNFHPPSPLDVAIAMEGDEANWISFPPFYAHVAMFVAGDDVSFGMRMRGADGQLVLLHGPDLDLENVRRHVELRWLQFLSSCLMPIRYGEEETAADLYRELGRIESETYPVPPAGAHSPFKLVMLKESDKTDLHRYPVGYPFVIDMSGAGKAFATGALIRTADLRFADFERVAVCTGPGQGIIEWSLTLHADKFDEATVLRRKDVMDFHLDHCADRGIKPAASPSVGLPVAVCR